MGLSVTVNDVHSQLNKATVSRCLLPRNVQTLRAAVSEAAESGLQLCISAGRHAMGGQQFASGSLMVDTRGLDRVLELDEDRGLATVEAGIQWPKLVRDLHDLSPTWSFRQKQTGGDRLSIGGSLAANIHSRGLAFRPFVGDIESFDLVCADGGLKRCSRDENRELFSLAIGGYGLFGVVYSVTMRLAQRHKLRRVVEEADSDDIASKFQERIDAGFEYGDFQFAIDNSSDDFLRKGVFACYEPVDDATAIPKDQLRLPNKVWNELVHMAHHDKTQAYETYRDFYLKTDGQIYWSDLHQMTPYVDDYHVALDRRDGAKCKGSEMITELYVPRELLAEFISAARKYLRENDGNVIYGTVRLIEKDTESFLPWARERWACTIFNLHVDHSAEGLAKAKRDFLALIDLALELGGSYYLTYHRWARRDQVEAAYPQFEEFLDLKRSHDPGGVFDSDWYRHYSELFACGSATNTNSPAALSTSDPLR